MIKIKQGVKFAHISFMLPGAMRIVFQTQMLAPEGYEITITSACDGKHHAKSKHYTGKAFDFRIRDFPADSRVWAKRIQRRLGDEYFVLHEKTHIHIQWNG